MDFGDRVLSSDQMTALLLVALASSAIYEPVQLTDENFEMKLKKSPVTFVFATRSDTSLCREVIPKFRAVAELLKAKCQFALLESETSPLTRERFHIIAFPSFFVFRGTELTAEYPGERDAVNMLAYLKRILGKPVITLDNSHDAQVYQFEHKTAVILAGTSLDSGILRTFEAVAQNLTDRIPFAVATTADALEQLGVDNDPTLTVHRGDDRAVVEFPLTDSVTFEILQAWVDETIAPRYWAHNSIVLRDFALDRRYTFLAFVDTKKRPSMDFMHDILDQVVTVYPTNLTYVYVDVNEMASMMVQVGFSGSKEPVFCIIGLAGSEVLDKYIFPERAAAAPDSVLTWVGNFLNATHGRKVTSEPRISGQTGPLYKIVAAEFQGTVSRPELDVVTAILVGSPEDRNATVEMVREVAEEFANQRQRSVVFTHIDATLNDLPGLQRGDWESPVVLLWPAEKDKKPLLLPGDMSPYQLMVMLVNHGKTTGKFVIPEKYEEMAAKEEKHEEKDTKQPPDENL
jgi:hypothetical protein